jgi:hypothetical protein
MISAFAILGLLLVVCVLATEGTKRAAQQRLRRQAAASAQWEAAARRRRQAQLDGIRRQTAREMQHAIHQLGQSPDFRRAASFAARAARAGVPASFRQRQFRRLRPLLINHLASRLQSGASLESACAGIQELVGNLGVAGYEAEYIVTEAQRRQSAAPAAAPDYRARLQELHAEHARRLEAIRATPQLDAEVQEQLLEAELERFRSEVLQEPAAEVNP